jgi:hypothetical protein
MAPAESYKSESRLNLEDDGLDVDVDVDVDVKNVAGGTVVEVEEVAVLMNVFIRRRRRGKIS